ncbi:MAG TPA: peptidoglycan-binding protein [Microthrixaceae bacterium]|nr:peptidoglycan-binding protein [Microthrixaceae bacterium]HNE73303.1 peptidoglycan-binding protein [Microthrixaceae bacterium]
MADLQRRLAAAGHSPGDPAGEFGESTAAAVSGFQQQAGLRSDGVCDTATWAALVESEFRLGDRLVCLRSPMMRGNDVAELQLRLGALGFDAGRVDGIFGPGTRAAVGDFQRNAGLVADEVCGPDTVEALMRLEGRAGRATVTAVRERDRLRRTMRSLTSLRVAIGSDTDLQPVTTRLAAALQSAGVTTVLLDGDWSAQAAEANDFAADVYLGLSLAPATVIEASYFEVPGFASTGGRHLAELVVRELPASPGWGIGAVTGMRLPILRETRSSAVLVQLGDRAMVDRNRDLIIASLQRALDVWASDPVADGPSATSETPGPARYPGVAS